MSHAIALILAVYLIGSGALLLWWSGKPPRVDQ